MRPRKRSRSIESSLSFDDDYVTDGDCLMSEGTSARKRDGVDNWHTDTSFIDFEEIGNQGVEVDVWVGEVVEGQLLPVPTGRLGTGSATSRISCNTPIPPRYSLSISMLFSSCSALASSAWVGRAGPQFALPLRSCITRTHIPQQA